MYTSNYFTIRLAPDKRRAAVWQEMALFFARWLSPNTKRVIEIGAGYCAWINAVRAPERYAVDVAETINRYAGNDVTPVRAHATDLSFAADTSTDAVLASNIFEHLTLEEVTLALQEIFRILRDGGRLFIMQPNFRFAWREYFDDYTHRSIFNELGLCGLLQANGFKIIKCWPRLTPFSFSSISLPIPRLLIRLYLRSPWRPAAKQMAVIVEKG